MEPIVFDGLMAARWERKIFEDMKAGGVTAANCTCCIWEELETTVKNIADWKRLFRENDDLIMQVYDVNDIWVAREAGKVGIILGWQNSSGFGDYIDSVALFSELGIRVVQLTYNTANSVGAGCYESRDFGLTDYGRHLVHELNEHGMLVDLSHVKDQTARDAAEASKKPVAYTHVFPAGLHSHPRNKSDEQLRYLAERGAFIGVAAVPTFMPDGYDSTISNYVDGILYVRNLVGEDQVGFGSDLVQGREPSFFEWIASDKGSGRTLVDMGGIPLLTGFEDASCYPRVVRDLQERKLSDDQVEKITGLNWISFMSSVW